VSVEGLIATLAVLMMVALWAGMPLFRNRSNDVIEDGMTRKRHERLLVYYDRVLTNIRDLDEDHLTGKINFSDY
jgi:hypothetical protein